MTIVQTSEKRDIKKKIERSKYEGMQEGLQVGIQTGEGRLMARLLDQRFGNLSVMDREKVMKADSQTLLQWVKKIFEAKTLEEILGEG